MLTEIVNIKKRMTNIKRRIRMIKEVRKIKRIKEIKRINVIKRILVTNRKINIIIKKKREKRDQMKKKILKEISIELDIGMDY